MIQEFSLREESAFRELMPKLKGKVFHVAKASFYESILSASAILPNREGLLSTTFGSSANSYFRNRGCVSVFDLRNPPDDEYQRHIGRCSPLGPAKPGSPIMVFFLGPGAIDRLIPWTGWETDRTDGEMVVPYLEAGHPGALSLIEIEGIMKIAIEEDPGSLASILRKGRNNAR